jgi:hypothetical protein
VGGIVEELRIGVGSLEGGSEGGLMCSLEGVYKRK